MPQITCEHVSMGYAGHPVVQDVSFSVEPGDYLCIVGENGAGKSTLMKGILGLQKPLSGGIRYQGLRQTDIGFLPQQTQVQKDFPATIWEVALSGCQNRLGRSLFYSRKEKQWAEDNLRRLGLWELRRRSYRDLSGGQQQRVLLARALCAANSVLLLDEPVAGLDPVVTAELYELIAELNRGGMTILMISHDIRSALQYGRQILHLQSKPLFFGPAEEYRRTGIGRRMLGEDSSSWE